MLGDMRSGKCKEERVHDTGEQALGNHLPGKKDLMRDLRRKSLLVSTLVQDEKTQEES